MSARAPTPDVPDPIDTDPTAPSRLPWGRSIVAELRAEALEESWALRRQDTPADTPAANGANGASGASGASGEGRRIGGWTVEATCPACGDTLIHVAGGRPDGLRAQTISRCDRCGLSLTTVVTVSDVTRDLRRRRKSATRPGRAPSRPAA